MLLQNCSCFRRIWDAAGRCVLRGFRALPRQDVPSAIRISWKNTSGRTTSNCEPIEFTSACADGAATQRQESSAGDRHGFSLLQRWWMGRLSQPLKRRGVGRQSELKSRVVTIPPADRKIPVAQSAVKPLVMSWRMRAVRRSAAAGAYPIDLARYRSQCRRCAERLRCLPFHPGVRDQDAKANKAPTASMD